MGASSSKGHIRTNIAEIEKENASLEYILAHEMMHSVQIGHSNLQIRNGKKYGLLGSIIHGLAREAGAESLAMLVYHQMERSGFDHKGKLFGDDQIYKKGRELFRKRFHQSHDMAVEQGGSEHDALIEGANAVFQSYMSECYAAIWAYADRYMVQYIEDIAKGRITKDDKVEALEADEILKSAYINDDLILAKEAHVPMTFEELFADKKRLCQAARYIEAYREVLGTPKDSAKRAFIRQQLVDDRNPFLGVNLAEVVKIWKSQQKADLPLCDRKSITDIMLDLAGYDESTQMHFDVSAKRDEPCGSSKKQTRTL
jgi:hypothetical protein